MQVIKMDVEGFETEVLKGATGLLQRHNVWFIMTGDRRAIQAHDASVCAYGMHLP